jgi:hypothetical protein
VAAKTDSRLTEKGMRNRLAVSKMTADLIDVLKAKNFFFVPFYGAFIGFLISKSEFVKNAPLLVQETLGATFVVCTIHALVITRLLFGLQAVVMLANLDRNTNGDFSKELSAGSKTANIETVQVSVLKLFQKEQSIYKASMICLLVSTLVVLIKMYIF